MAYVLDYTIIAAGLPYQAQGVSHGDALMSFIANPAGLTAGYRKGRLEVGDGEQITVVGVTQDAHTEYEWAQRRCESLRQSVAKQGRPKKGEPSKDELRKLLADAERELPSKRPQAVPITFTMRAVTKFRALDSEEVERENSLYDILKEQAQDAIDNEIAIEIKVHYERRHPIGNLLRGVPQSIEDDGVWMHNHLIPFEDMDEIVRLETEVTA